MSLQDKDPGRPPRPAAPSGARRISSAPKMLSIAEVAELFNVSGRTIRRWIKTEGLRSHKLVGAVRLSEEDVNQFLATRRR